MKASRNKTIDFSLSEGEKYLKRCVSVVGNVQESEILNKTVLGDAMLTLDYLPRKFVDLLIVDPPYNMNKSFGDSSFKKMTDIEYAKYTESWIIKVIPLLKDTASVYVCCDWESGIIIAEILKKYFKLRNRITWQREKGRGAKANWKNGMEDIWFATVSDDYVYNLDAVKIRKKVVAPYRRNGEPKDWEETGNGNFRNTCPSNFWDDVSVPYWSMPENTAHPTQKPEKLLAKLILASSNEGDVVLDPFLGSGTTSVTAYKLNRNYVGIEKEPQYCAWAEKRLETAQSDRSIQGYTDGVFWERNTFAAQRKNKSAIQKNDKK